MDDDKIITITNDDGSEEKVELVTELESVEGSHYIVYTKNEKDDSDNILVYTLRVENNNGINTLFDLTDQEWQDIQEYLSDEENN